MRRMASPKWPTPGSTTAVGAAPSSGGVARPRGRPRPRARAPCRRCAGCSSRSRAPRRRASQAPLRRGHAGHARVGRDRLRQSARASALNAALDDVVGVAGHQQAQVHRQAGVVGEARGRTPRAARSRSRRSPSSAAARRAPRTGGRRGRRPPARGTRPSGSGPRRSARCPSGRRARRRWPGPA